MDNNKKTFLVKCPHCNQFTEICYSEDIPNLQNECLTKCDICDEPFCLLPTWMCDGCTDWFSCAGYSFVDVLAELVVAGLIDFNVETKKRIVK
jgi:hypothetical protein